VGCLAYITTAIDQHWQKQTGKKAILNGLANLGSRKKIKKKAYAGRGQETKWEIPG